MGFFDCFHGGYLRKFLDIPSPFRLRFARRQTAVDAYQQFPFVAELADCYLTVSTHVAMFVTNRSPIWSCWQFDREAFQVVFASRLYDDLALCGDKAAVLGIYEST